MFVKTTVQNNNDRESSGNSAPAVHAQRQVTRKLTLAPCKTINPMENMYDRRSMYFNTLILFPVISETTSTSPISISSIVSMYFII